MNSFSQRKGLKPVKNVVQVESMDDDLRNGLWNVFSVTYWGEPVHLSDGMKELGIALWLDYFKRRITNYYANSAFIHGMMQEYFFGCGWYEVYDFLEFVVSHYSDNRLNETFMDRCNHILEREMSAYRFVGGVITQLTSEEEIAEIEQALNSPVPLKPVSTHLKTALDLLSDKSKPDYRNSIKESISAVESMCNLITGGKDTLGEALKKVETKVAIHPALKKGFGNIYGYTNDASGIRHALLDEHNLDFEDAKYMLVSCSAFINYLVSKASKAGITF